MKSNSILFFSMAIAQFAIFRRLSPAPRRHRPLPPAEPPAIDRRHRQLSETAPIALGDAAVAENQPSEVTCTIAFSGSRAAAYPIVHATSDDWFSATAASPRAIGAVSES